MGDEEKLPTCSVMSKKRFNEIRELVMTVTRDEEKTNAFMRGVAEVMKYDPERGSTGGSLNKVSATTSAISKKRFNIISSNANNIFDNNEIVATIMEGFSRIMRFNPVVGVYTPEMSKKMYEFQKRRVQELNISFYKYTNGREYYEKNKELLNRRRTDNARKQALFHKMDELFLKG